jgi:Zn-finger nucleic acid-binding protein
MKCPTCTTVDLVMSERQGIEIDYCPSCRGVWLDRGELDKIIERSAAAYGAQPQAASSTQAVSPPQAVPAPQPAPFYGHPGKGHHDDHDDHHGYGKRSFLKDLFD